MLHLVIRIHVYSCLFLLIPQGLWIYTENQNNGEAFSNAEQKKWNAQKKAEADMKK
jgi:hypothetical protein